MADEVKPESPAKEDKKEKRYPIDTEREPITTHHQIGDLKYSATVGMMPIKDEFGETEAGIFYTFYKKESEEDRPLMFTFNGGPGSASVWLHLGAVGPKRVKMQPDGDMPQPPFELVDNPETWLNHADLVFIDPVGTGFSRPAKEGGGDKFWSLQGDVESVGEFIRMILSRHNRWRSPLFLAGESYGTTRAAGLAGNLIGKGIAFNGIILVSSILNFQTARFMKGNDLPYSLFLPTYAATAWYHRALSGRRTLGSVLKEAEEFAGGEYVLALAKGDAMSATERKRIIKKLVRLTGLTEDYLENCNLRPQIHRFCKELLRNDKRTVGRLDSRFKGIDGLAVSENPEHDPSSSAILPPYTAMINDYLRRELGWQTDLPYYVFNPGQLWSKWSYGDAGAGYPDTADSLRAAMAKNPFMKIFVASGYYDLATPYYATEYTLSHMGLEPRQRQNITTRYYEAGHMMYIDEQRLLELSRDIGEFMRKED